MEERYIHSTERHSKFNPAMVAAMNVAPKISENYLNSHLNSLSNKTISELKDGDYLPMIIVGAGVHGLTATAEIVRQRPDMASNALVIDEADRVGGPFAKPKAPCMGIK